VAQAGLAYKLYQKKFSGPRWEALVKKGAKKQRLLWASTSVKNPAYPDTLYVAPLIGPDTVSHLISPYPVSCILCALLCRYFWKEMISCSRGSTHVLNCNLLFNVSPCVVCFFL
jgi:hypothetical protein